MAAAGAADASGIDAASVPQTAVDPDSASSVAAVTAADAASAAAVATAAAAADAKAHSPAPAPYKEASVEGGSSTLTGGGVGTELVQVCWFVVARLGGLQVSGVSISAHSVGIWVARQRTRLLTLAYSRKRCR